MNKEKFIIFESSGGIGKSILATAVIASIKEQYPEHKILVQSSHPFVFLNNPNIHRIIPHGMPNLYADFVKGNELIFMCDEPYRSHGYLAQDRHLIQSWCECINVKYNGSPTKLYLTPMEIESVKLKLKIDKPLLLIQSNGGPVNKDLPYNWNRDLPHHQAQQIVNHFSKQYAIGQVLADGQPKLQNVFHVTPKNQREIFALLLFSKGRLFIDSMCQHAAAALNLPSTVCWITNKPEVFGYLTHKNILPTAQKRSEISEYDSGLLEFDFSGNQLHKYPFKDMNVFDTNEIIESIYEQLKY